MNWHRYFTFRKEDAQLLWKDRPRQDFPSDQAHRTWNSRYGLQRAGLLKKSAYCYVQIDGKRYAAHRIIWEMHNGAIPEGMDIDHKNRKRRDNRLSNLRLCTNAENRRNSKRRRDNRSKLKGVSISKNGTPYARITLNRECFYLGTFSTPEAAHEAYCAAAKHYHQQFARTK